MDEQEEQKEEEQETTTENSTERSEPKANVKLKDVNAAAERMEAANAERKEILDREEAIAAERKLGGMSEAGQEPVKPKEETPEEYKDRVMRGDA